ncbi:hypothetical protein G9A89_003031 [Geosiphon pyriformis]|nr:hypothetical protein G9A89_003031 [Geosiphon pyriformis]
MTSCINNIQEKRPKTSGNICKNNFKVATTPDTTTLEYYQLIYTHCKQRFNIPDGIEVIKKSVYQYIENHINNYFFGNYNISELGTENLNSDTFATYFQELNFNIIEYCEEKYPVQSQYSIDFESETKTSNKDKQKLKQYSRTNSNTPILQKTIAKHLQTPEQGTSVKLPLSITSFPISLVQSQTPSLPLIRFSRIENFWLPKSPIQQQEPLQTSTSLLDFSTENQSEHFETAIHDENNSESSEEEESIHSESEEDEMTAYIAKIPEFNGEDIKTSPQEWLNQEQQANDQFITGLKDKLIKKIRLHAPEDLNSAIQHAKRYEMAMEEANRTKLSKTISPTNNNNNPKDINHLKDKIKTTSHYLLITSLRIAITVEFLATRKEIAGNYKETNKTEAINITLCHNSLIIKHHHQLTICQDRNIKPTTINLLHSQYNNSINNPFNITNRFAINNNRINPNNQLVPRNPVQPRPTHYHTQSSYFKIPEKQDFHHTALSEGRAAAQQNPSYTPTTIPPAKIAENANLSDIFPFEFKTNELPFLLNNAAANKQKTITAMYTEAEIKGKAICLILDSGSTGSIITYQLMQQLKKNTIIVTADGMKKTPVGEIDNFSFTINGITISVKVLVMDVPQYQALTQELTISYQGQHTWVPATCGTFNKHSEKAPAFEFELEEEKPIIETFMALESTSNWANETEQQYFSTNNPRETKEPVTLGWNVPYVKPEPRKQCPYIPLKCKNCHKKLSSMEACISPEEEYENHTCYYCKTCYREQWGHLIKRSRKWNNIPCLTCGDMLSEECNWINVAIKEEVCNQTCQYALSISEKVKRETSFDAAYNSALNKLYYYPHNAKMIFDLAIALINGATQENVHQIKESEYIVYTFEIAGYNYEDEVEPALQLKYFNNNGQGIKPEKAHEINAGYDLRYPDKDTLVLKPKSLTKINLKIALKIPPRAIVQITSQSFLASKRINVRGGIIDAGYTGDITVMLQNKTDKPFKIEHAEKIAQAIYLSLINILGLQLVNQKEQLGKSERRTQGFGSTGQFTVPVNIALNEQKETKKVRVTFYNPNNYLIVLLNNVKIGVIHNNIFQQELPQTVLNFSEIIEHSLSKNNPNSSSENYHVVMEKLSRINMGQLEPQQQSQLKELIVEFADIFAENNNDLGRTDLVQHQIYTEDAKSRQQQAY